MHKGQHRCAGVPATHRAVTDDSANRQRRCAIADGTAETTTFEYRGITHVCSRRSAEVRWLRRPASIVARAWTVFARRTLHHTRPVRPPVHSGTRASY